MSLLQRFGKQPIILDDTPTDPSNLKIGSEYVPPLGGVSVIDNRFVAKNHAAKLAKRNYKPYDNKHYGNAAVHAHAASAYARLCGHSVLAIWVLVLVLAAVWLA
jgi:hypothetical protein